MTCRYFQEQWENLTLVGAKDDVPLKAFLKDCLGEHRGGLLFIGRGTQDGNTFILRVDDQDDCYRRVADSGDEGQDWRWLGALVYEGKV